MVRVMVVGCGGIAPSHIEGYLKFGERARITALADRDLARAEGLKERFGLGGAAILGDYREGLDEADAVSICTPPSTHEPVALDALKNGCHVLLEKPMAPSLAACDRILAAARANGRVLSVVGQSRYISGIRNVIDMVKSGSYGRVRYARVQSVWYRGQSYYDLQWRGRWTQEGGGCTLNHSIHHIDLLNWVKGMPVRVSAHMKNLGHDNSEEEDFSSAFLEYADGSVAEITSALVCHGEPQFLTFQMEKAGLGIPFAAYASKPRANGFPEPDAEMAARLERDFRARPALPYENHDGQVGAFLSDIEGGHAPVAGGQSGRDCIELITAIYKSAITGRTVELPIAENDPYYGDAWRSDAPHFHEKHRDVRAFADTTITDFKGKF